ncbi:MAG: group II intron reverse transcriptase domain-containing protein [Candidatus Pacebacteria bacterium]|nr:group II intron reverse transcriptase domain-containing protein [Candidatus Paceibacterota bacterium]
MKIKLRHSFEDIISVENLLEAWKEFLNGKRNRKDVQEFSLHLMDNIFSLHKNLFNLSYKHGEYQSFNICDPKPRKIHKAMVKDRLLHHALCRKLSPFFDKTFIVDSYSCRLNKGTHRAINRFRAFAYKVSKNHTKTCWVLKCDIHKFFASINHLILFDVLKQYIFDQNILWILKQVIDSFEVRTGLGLPLGNFTSQLFANIYMNELDQFAKHKLRVQHYIRYADDFVLMTENKKWLEAQISFIRNFLKERLALKLHSDKISIKSIASGIDFLGWIHFSDHRILRTSTKRKMMKRIKESTTPETLNSYLGLLSHGNTHKVKKNVLRTYILNQDEPNQY